MRTTTPTRPNAPFASRTHVDMPRTYRDYNASRVSFVTDGGFGSRLRPAPEDSRSSAGNDRRIQCNRWYHNHCFVRRRSLDLVSLKATIRELSHAIRIIHEIARTAVWESERRSPTARGSGSERGCSIVKITAGYRDGFRG